MGAIPVRSHAITALIAMSIFWCGAVAGMLILHSTSATEPAASAPEPARAAPISTAAPTTTVRVVAVHNALPIATVASPG
jgi:flagellar basal body-associated protein FliL